MGGAEIRYRSGQDTPEVGKFYQQARKLYDSGSKREGLVQIQNYEKSYPQGQFADEANFLLAKASFDNNDFETAAKEYQKIADLNPPSRLRGDSIYLRALCLYNLGRRTEALTSLSALDPREVSAGNRSKVFTLWGKTASEEGRWLEATLAYVKAHKEGVGPSQKDLEALIDELVESRLSEVELNFIQQEYPVDYPAASVQMRLVMLRLASGDRGAALTLLQSVLANAQAGSKNHLRATQYVNRLKSLGDAKVGRIGALLPLSGKLETAGRAVVDGLQMAIAQPTGKGQPPLELVLADTGPSDQTALAAFDRLVLEDKVMAVVGPLASNQSELIAGKAVEYGIPYIALSQKPGIVDKGPYVFRLALSPERQVRALVGYARERLGATRFAILFPEDNFGKEFATEYFRAVADFGGEVTASESYNPDQSDFKVQIDNMVGKAFPHFRKTEAADNLKTLEEKLGRAPTKKELDSASLPPIVDFDVLFIPDTYKPLGQIVPALTSAFAGYSVTSPQLMGPATWNNRNLLSRAGQYLENAIFVDAFSSERQSRVTKEFVEKYQLKKGTQPSSLSAQGYDVGMALRLAYGNSTSPENRDELRGRLETLGSFDGVMGVHTWDVRRDALSEMQLFQIRRAAFVHQGGIAIKSRTTN